jgi:Rieske Fe-S protein
MSKSVSSTHAAEPSTATVEPRRGFVAKATALVLGALAYAGPALAGLAAFFHPWGQKGQAGQFVRLATLDALPEDGTPRKFAVVMDRTDAWNRFPKEPVGAVYLRRTGSNAVEALQVVCPHAGCFIDFDSEKKIFYCPCHLANFELSGKRTEGKFDSPRDMDTLDVEVRDKEVWVKFQTYQTNTPKKVDQA